MKQTGMKKLRAILLVPFMALSIGCTSAYAKETPTAAPEAVQSEAPASNETNDAGNSAVSTTETNEYFTDRDMEQTPNLSEAKTLTMENGKDISITEEGIYVLKGTAKDVTVTVEAAKDAKVQIVLDSAVITNSDRPCIYVKSADKVFVTTVSGSENTLAVTGEFTADGETNTDGVIFAKDDLVLNGTGNLTVTSSDNGIVSKDDLKITGGTIRITAENKGLDANDSIRIADGTITIDAKDDGLHAEDNDDDTTGFIYILGGNLKVSCGDDAIHATTTLVIDGGTLDITGAEGLEATDITVNDGDITINASDDGMNAGQKSNAYAMQITINGGNIKINMGSGDTDAIDSNGNITVNGGTINITGPSAFDCDGKAVYNGGTIIVNGETVNAITSQMMGGRGGKTGMRGGMEGQGTWGGMNGSEMPSDGMDGQGSWGEMNGMQGGRHGGMRPGMNGTTEGMPAQKGNELPSETSPETAEQKNV